MTADRIDEILQMLLRLGSAYGLCLLVGLERGRAARTAGFRTFPLVALGACAYVLLGDGLEGASADAKARVIQGLMTGIGFVGGGAILKEKGEVHGLATAAGLWNAAAIGLASANGRYELAVILALVNVATLHMFRPSSQHEPRLRG